jgi:hypothetical protein
MCIARYKVLDGHPYFMYSVELFVQTNGKLIQIATLNCKDDEELAQATQWVDYTIKGEESN